MRAALGLARWALREGGGAFRFLRNKSQWALCYGIHSVSAHYPRLQIPTLRISLIPA